MWGLALWDLRFAYTIGHTAFYGMSGVSHYTRQGGRVTDSGLKWYLPDGKDGERGGGSVVYSVVYSIDLVTYGTKKSLSTTQQNLRFWTKEAELGSDLGHTLLGYSHTQTYAEETRSPTDFRRVCGGLEGERGRAGGGVVRVIMKRTIWGARQQDMLVVFYRRIGSDGRNWGDVNASRTDMVKRDVEIETVGECVDEIDKLAELIDEHEVDQNL
ncbi:hypothetical protein Tco_1337785 [Tanacetum coccineum]